MDQHFWNPTKVRRLGDDEMNFYLNWHFMYLRKATRMHRIGYNVTCCSTFDILASIKKYVTSLCHKDDITATDIISKCQKNMNIL